MAERALVLFAHGARSAAWAAPFERLRDLARARTPDVDVSLAFLELMEPRLPEHVDALAASGVRAITVVPVFLGQGGHVLRDLPPMIDTLRARHPGVEIRVAQAVGEDPTVLDAITSYCLRCLGDA
ncbi:MAG TPA: CbiX/SirB N-terminal domain-containing protein [Telluria sp.]|nr:CbiX/SirB N-terminal domain-containing protein [Telluria sp.]